MKEYTITHNEAGQRLDKYIAKILSLAPMSFHYKMLRKKNITLNNKRADGKEKLSEGDVVKFFLSDETFDKFCKKQTVSKKAELKPTPSFADSGLIILYEDDDIIALDKPVGMLSQKARATDISVNDYLLSYLGRDKTFTPSICNRLDRNTSGIILCGKSMTGSRELSRMLKDRSLSKYYRCIVLGQLAEDNLTGYIKKDEKTNKVTFREHEFAGGDRIETAWRPVRTLNVCGKECTELEVHLITGKTHQIRGHLAGIGHPILGDYKYGNRGINDACKKEFGFCSQLLHAYRVEFPDYLSGLPNCSGLVITAPLPETFKLRLPRNK